MDPLIYLLLNEPGNGWLQVAGVLAIGYLICRTWIWPEWPRKPAYPPRKNRKHG